MLGVSLLIAGLTSGCGAGGPERLRVAVEADPDANQNSPIAVAVLVVYDKDVMRDLSKLSAGEWFEQSDQRQRDNPDMSDFDIVQWEIMPGQKIKELDLELQGKPAKGLVFADYYTEGRHRVRFHPEKRILVVLAKDRFTIVDREDD